MGSSWRDRTFYFRREHIKIKAHDTIKNLHIFIIIINISFTRRKSQVERDNHNKDFITTATCSREMKSDIVLCAMLTGLLSIKFHCFIF